MKKPPYRTWIAVMVFFSTFQNYMLRANFSVSLVAMVNSTAVDALKEQKNVNETGPFCLRGETHNVTTVKHKTEDLGSVKFVWTENEQSQLLGAYFYGYLTTILFGGTLSELVGPWHVIFWSSLVSTVLVAISPVCSIYGDFAGTFANRFFTGFFGGPVYPALNVIMAKWAPPEEKGKFMSALMGNTIGTVFGFSAVGAITQSLGWEWGFYLLAICMVAYLIAFFFIVSDTPDKSRWVSQAERNYITQAQGSALSKKKAAAPLLKILKNFRFWIMVVAQFGNLWGLNLVLLYLPKYYKQTIGFNIRSSGFLASLPYIGRMVASSIFGMIGDWMRRKGLMGVSKIRKLFIVFSHFFSAALLFPIGPARCEKSIIVALMTLNQCFTGAVVVGHLVNPQDLSPNFAGTLYSLMNFIGMTTGFIVPAINGAIQNVHGKTPEAAGYIFSLGGIALIVCGIVFILFGSAEVQPFNKIESTSKEEQQLQPTKKETDE